LAASPWSGSHIAALKAKTFSSALNLKGEAK
jgi:hypothetical protein